jgi:hypothetical protein
LFIHPSSPQSLYCNPFEAHRSILSVLVFAARIGPFHARINALFFLIIFIWL